MKLIILCTDYNNLNTSCSKRILQQYEFKKSDYVYTYQTYHMYTITTIYLLILRFLSYFINIDFYTINVPIKNIKELYQFTNVKNYSDDALKMLISSHETLFLSHEKVFYDKMYKLLTTFDRSSILFLLAIYKACSNDKVTIDQLSIEALINGNTIEDFIDYGKTLINGQSEHVKYDIKISIYHLREHNYIGAYDYVMKCFNNGKNIILIHDFDNKTVTIRDFDYRLLVKTCYMDGK
jgi:hypothetical protein